MKKKRLTDNQSELVAAFLPQKLQKNKKLSTSVKLVLANIYQLYYYDNNYGKRTVYRTREDFMKDIDAKDKNDVLRPHAVLMQNDMVYIKSGVRGRATEYTLNDELYAMLPKQIRGEVSEKFAETLNCNGLSNSSLQIEDTEVISPSYNELSYNGLQHSNVPSETDTESEKEIEKEKHGISTTWYQDEVAKETASVQATDEVETISAETVKASAHGDSFSSFNSEKESHAVGSFDDVDDLISADVTGTSSDEETTHDATIPSVGSSNDDLTVADRLTLLQSEDKNPPQVAPHPPLTEFITNVKSAIRNGVYDWSLTLTEIPDYITGDDYTQIVGDALRAQPDHKSHLENISFMELGAFAKELMENRLTNKDIPQIVRQNQYNIRHEKYHRELMNA